MSLEARIAELIDAVKANTAALTGGKPVVSTDKAQPAAADKPKPEAAQPEVGAVDYAALRKSAGETLLVKAKANRSAVVALIEATQDGAKKLGDITDENLSKIIDGLAKIA
jgi:hypothetical protein